MTPSGCSVLGPGAQDWLARAEWFLSALLPLVSQGEAADHPGGVGGALLSPAGGAVLILPWKTLRDSSQRTFPRHKVRGFPRARGWSGLCWH